MRRRYLYRPKHPRACDHGFVDAADVIDPLPESRNGPFVMPDIAPFQSPLDYSEISSRSQLREHEKKHGVRQCGELSKPQDFNIWKKS